MRTQMIFQNEYPISEPGMGLNRHRDWQPMLCTQRVRPTDPNT